MSVAHSGGSKKKGWRLPDVPVYGSSSYSQWKLAQSKSLDIDYPAATDSLTFIGPDPIIAFQQTVEQSSQVQNSDDPISDNDKSFLPHTLNLRQPEIEYAYPTHDSQDDRGAQVLQLPTYQPRIPVQMSDEELRLRSIASFRSVLLEIQTLIVADGLNASPLKDKNSQLDLVARVLPSIEMCTIHGTGVPDEIVPEPFYGINYFSII